MVIKINNSVILVFTIFIFFLTLPLVGDISHKINTITYDEKKHMHQDFIVLVIKNDEFKLIEKKLYSSEYSPLSRTLTKNELKLINSSYLKDEREQLKKFEMKNKQATLHIVKGNSSFRYKYNITESGILAISYSHLNIGKGLSNALIYFIILYLSLFFLCNFFNLKSAIRL